MYRDRIKKPIDIIKQPWLDFERAVSYIVYVLLKAFVKPRQLPKSINKILLIRRNRLGDAVNVLPIIQAIKVGYPGVEVHVLASQYNQAIFSYCDLIDCLHVVDEKWGLGKLTFFLNPVLQGLRKQQFDMVIGLGGYSSVLSQLVYLAKGKYSVGIKSKKGTFYDLIYDVPVIDRSMKRHHVDDMAHIVREAGFVLPETLPCYCIWRPAAAESGVVALCPDVKRKQSQYSVDLYVVVVSKLLALRGIKKIILFTESAESKYRLLEMHGVEWLPTSSLNDFVRQASRCQWAISAEGGGAHILGVLGIPTLVISGMGHQAYWRPYAKNIKILDRKDSVDTIEPREIVNEFFDLMSN